MAAQDFFTKIAGRWTRVFAILSSAGAGDANKIPALDATGKLDLSFMPSGVGGSNKVALASEALAAGDMVNLWNNSGTVNARKADNTAAGKEAHGFVVGAVSSGANATVILGQGVISGLSGLTPGAYYWLGTTGAKTTSAPTTAGNIQQLLGHAISATEFFVNVEEPVTM